MKVVDLAASVRFHVEAFGFEVAEVREQSVLLTAGGSEVGRLRLELLDNPSGAGDADTAPWDPGARLLGIYSRDLDVTVEGMRAAGGEPRDAVSYPYGSSTLSEMVGRGTDGVWWTAPLAVTGQHRPSPAFASDPDRTHSELHTVVLVVDDHDEALRFFTAGGLVTVFDGTMQGGQFEDLVGMPPGASLRLSFLGGEEHLPARWELMSFTGVSGVDRSASPLGIHEVRYRCQDVQRTRRALLDAGGTAPFDGAPDVVVGPVGVRIKLVEEGGGA